MTQIWVFIGIWLLLGGLLGKLLTMAIKTIFGSIVDFVRKNSQDVDIDSLIEKYGEENLEVGMSIFVVLLQSVIWPYFIIKLMIKA